MEYVNTLESLLLMDASKARVWDMTFKLQYAKMELQKWRFQETPNASMQFELSTGFLIAECVLHARRIFTLCRHFMGNIAWNRNMLGTLYEMEWFTTNHNRSLTFKYSFKCNTKAAALADEWPGSWLVLWNDPSVSQSVFTITEKASNRAFSWLKAPTSAFTFKTLC